MVLAFNQGGLFIMRRRQFIIGAGILGSATFLPWMLSPARANRQWLVSACTDHQGHNFVAAVDAKGEIRHSFALPARAHDVLAIPNKSGCAIVFARRPGRFAMEVDFINGRVNHKFESQPDSHFFGHGTLSQDGRYLMTTENDFSSGKGLIVVRDTANYQVLDAYYSGGIGPHECALMPDANTLVIANGGILTHPEQPRKKLNLDSMRPNLSYMNIHSGKILGSYELHNSQLSIRHLDVSQSGKVFVGLQYQGPKSDNLPLAFSHQGQDQPEYLKAAEHIWPQLNQYIASVCVDEQQGLVAISCPRANLITFWDLQQGSYISQYRFRDSAGLAWVNGQLLASNGKGQIFHQIDKPEQGQIFKHNHLRWDNHMTAIEIT